MASGMNRVPSGPYNQKHHYSAEHARLQPQRAAHNAQRAPESEHREPHSEPTYSPGLLSNPRLAARGNGPAQIALMRQMQQGYGNRAVQRFLQRTTSQQPGRHMCGPGCNHAVQRTHRGAPVPVQRHSAYEHYLLGQVAPSKLKEVPQVREAVDEKKRLEAEVMLLAMAEAEGAAVESQRQEAQRKLVAAQTALETSPVVKNVKHTIKQEMDRLWKWKDNPEALKGEQTGKAEKGKDGQWQVPYVALPVKGDNKDTQAGKEIIVVTYSEINTLPDFFGNPETIANTRKSKVLGLLQGVREQSYNELGKLYEEMFGENINKLKGTIYDDTFKGAKGPTGKAWVASVYEMRTESEVNEQTLPGKGEAKGKSEQYFAALERNACHFAPYSWDAWQEYHENALKDAKASKQKRDAGATKEAEALANNAMLKNAFGEHYLQDSFAGGHLIDKTRVMQTFLKWVNKDKGHLGSTDKGKAQWAMLSTIADQDLKSNPQALDDMMHRGEADKVEKATGKVGLQVKPEIEFMMWWRHQAAKDDKRKNLTAGEAAMLAPMAAGSMHLARELMNKLVRQKFAELKTEGFFKKKLVYSLNQSMIDVLKKDKGAYNAGIAQAADKQKKPHDFKKEAHEFNLAAYNLFLSNAYIQGATKYFHDKYCVQGVHVITGEGTDIGTIYGDSNMLKAGGQIGVEYSAETSRRSRDAVFNAIESGQDPQGVYATPDIRKRFPAQVKPGPNDAPLSLADWNAEKLFTEYDKGWLNPASSNKARAGYKFMADGGISGGSAIDVEKIAQHDAGPF